MAGSNVTLPNVSVSLRNKNTSAGHNAWRAAHLSVPHENEIRMGFLQGSTQRPVPYHDKLHRGAELLHGAVRRDGRPRFSLTPPAT